MKSVDNHKDLIKHSKPLSVCQLFLVAAIFLANIPAVASGNELCLPVKAGIDALFVSEGCASPVGLCTAGAITKGGFLNGETSFTALDVAPGAGLPGGVEPGTTLSYTGILNIVTPHGALTLSDVGVFDQFEGVFSELDRITEGTGRFGGAVGVLFIYGDSTADGTGFTGTIKGEICMTE